MKKIRNEKMKYLNTVLILFILSILPDDIDISGSKYGILPKCNDWKIISLPSGDVFSQRT
jgi:hypothetical protein